MSEAFREQRPLLCEDLSEEEQFPEYPRRFRSIYRGRAKTSARGATAIITRWPDHWSSSFTYWWIGLCIMALTVFVIYNIVIAFVLFPTALMKPTRPRTTSKLDYAVPPNLPEIFMHLFVTSDHEADLNKYLPYVEIMSDKHINYKFNFILIYNDTGHEVVTQSAEETNEIAFNSIWSKDVLNIRKQRSRKNIKIRHVALSQFMDESPLRKLWRKLPSHFFEFLVKAISIWDKGGVAVNPEILTPRSPNILYIDKLENILNKFENNKKIVPNEPKQKKLLNKHKDKLKKKVNNIRDIINILENENNDIVLQENLTVAENVRSPVISLNARKLLSTSTLNSPETKVNTWPAIIELPEIPLISTKNETEKMDNDNYHSTNIKSQEEGDTFEIVHESLEVLGQNNETRLSFLPLFLEFLFHGKPSLPKEKPVKIDNNLARHRKSAIPNEKNKLNATASLSNLINNPAKKSIENYKPTITAKTVVSDTLPNVDLKHKDIVPNDNDELTIDIKGQLVITRAPCHAFIGTIFSNVIHHSEEESLQDFIVAELSLFCKGLLSTCRGIDVILI